MLEFEVDRCSRKCNATERELQPGETYYSVLVPEGTGLKRLDYAADAWTAPPDDAVAWWSSQMPGGGKRTPGMSNDTAWEHFLAIENDASKADVRYVLGLFLIRRRIARWEHTERDEQGRELMVLYCPRQEMEIRVPVQSVSEERVAQIQQELSQLIGLPSGVEPPRS